jgi:hypothetical protein
MLSFSILSKENASMSPKKLSGGGRIILGLALLFLLVTTDSVKGQADRDPHRPSCSSAECRTVKTFLKTHYCGEPTGNGPDDACEIRPPKEHPNARVIADYECKWVDNRRSCQQNGEPTTEFRNLLVKELHRLGLPAKATGQIYFTVWQARTAGWYLAEAYYDHIVGSNVSVCQVIAIIDRNSHLSVLRKAPYQKTDADINTVTTWSPLDVADVNGDGKIEVILEGNAYEDHWMEVDTVWNGIHRTVFSGLGYYL